MNDDKKIKILMDEVKKLKTSSINDRVEIRKLQDKLSEQKKATIDVADNHSRIANYLKISFVGSLLLNVFLLVFVTILKKSVFLECRNWFKDRAVNIYNFLCWLKDVLYGGTYQFIEGKLHAGEIGSTLLTIFVMILIVVGLSLLVIKAKDKFEMMRYDFTEYFYKKGTTYLMFKNVISADIAIGLFVACLVFYEAFKKLIPSLNIFSIWLLLTVVGIFIWYGADLFIDKLKDRFEF